MAQNLNFVTTNPAQWQDRITELQVATQLDEANFLAVAEYTAAGAIVPGGKAFLKTGAASAFTLALPLAGAQLTGGQDGAVMKIVAVDAEAYTVTTPANGLNGADHIATFGAAVADNVTLEAFGGVWYVTGNTGVTLS